MESKQKLCGTLVCPKGWGEITFKDDGTCPKSGAKCCDECKTEFGKEPVPVTGKLPDPNGFVKRRMD